LTTNPSSPSFFKVSIPQELYRSLIRIQAENDCDFNRACIEAAILVDPRKEAFRLAVNKEAIKLARSQFMNQLNQARETIRKEAYEQGVADGFDIGMSYYAYKCNICGESIPISDKTWKDASQYLTGKGWGHRKCHENRK
jgi:hypothetical protein